MPKGEQNDPIFDAIQEAVDEQTAQDSEAGEQPVDEQPEGAPETVDEEGLEDPLDPDEEPEDGAERDNEEDPEEPEEGDEESGEDEDDGESEGEDDQVFTVQVDGEELEVDLDELKAGYQRQAHYTKGRQQVNKEREQLREIYGRIRSWYEEKSQDPASWAAELAQNSDDPAQTLAEAISASGEDVEQTFAKTVRHLVTSGKLSQELVEALNLQNISQQAGDPRVDRLERQLQESQRRQREEEQRQQQVQALETQWQTLVRDEGVQFESEAQEYDAKIALLRFAQQRGIGDLPTAWAAAQYLRQKQQGSAQPSQKPAKAHKAKGNDEAREAAQKTVEKKRKTSAMSRTPTGGPAPQPKPRQTTDSAIREAAAELGIFD